MKIDFSKMTPEIMQSIQAVRNKINGAKTEIALLKIEANTLFEGREKEEELNRIMEMEARVGLQDESLKTFEI